MLNNQHHNILFQFDGAGGIVVGGSLGEREDLDTEMNSNEALAVALQVDSLINTLHIDRQINIKTDRQINIYVDIQTDRQ